MNMDFFNFNNIAWLLDNIDEGLYGKRPRGTKRDQNTDEDKTIRELELSEKLGLPIKIIK